MRLSQFFRQTAEPAVWFRISNLTQKVELAGRVEVADHGSRRTKGLLGREGLPSGEGLWIVPCEAIHTIGMRFAIDLVYLDRKLRVRKVRSNVVPWRFSGCLSAHSVIELPAGTVRLTKTRKWDQLELSAPGPSPLNP